jgi:hypothetical protein
MIPDSHEIPIRPHSPEKVIHSPRRPAVSSPPADRMASGRPPGIGWGLPTQPSGDDQEAARPGVPGWLSVARVPFAAPRVPKATLAACLGCSGFGGQRQRLFLRGRPRVTRTVRSRRQPCPERSARDVQRPEWTVRDMSDVANATFAATRSGRTRSLTQRPERSAGDNDDVPNGPPATFNAPSGPLATCVMPQEVRSRHRGAVAGPTTPELTNSIVQRPERTVRDMSDVANAASLRAWGGTA